MTKTKPDSQPAQPNTPRKLLVVCLLVSLAVLILGRAVFLQLAWSANPDKLDVRPSAALQTSYSEQQLKTPAFRGSILDRNGDVLAVSIPLSSLWANPQLLAQAEASQHAQLAQALDMKEEDLSSLLSRYGKKRFMYLRRHMKPKESARVTELGIPGVGARTEYQRFYPTAEVSAPLIGVTNIDDRGHEGLELTYDKWLSGKPGVEHVLHDRKGAIIRKLADTDIGREGGDLQLSLDIPIQYAAYRALKETVLHHNAKAGTAVVVDVKSGGILAMTSYPAPNPHKLTRDNVHWLRNRVAMDVMEPGSLIKPFVVATALELGVFQDTDMVDTSPGCISVATKQLCDPHNHGLLTLGGILMNSSQVGIVKVAQNLAFDDINHTLVRAGIGRRTHLPLPVDRTGHLSAAAKDGSLGHISMSYGYGLSGTPLHWARAYTVLANRGKFCPLSLIRQASETQGSCQQVMREDVANSVLRMLRDAASDHGTGQLAQVFGYQVAGKTATVRKFNPKAKGYTGEEHIATFAGIAPYTNPRIVVVVSVDEPSFYYYGGAVAAPLFSKIAGFSLRRLHVAPDHLEVMPVVPVIAGNVSP